MRCGGEIADVLIRDIHGVPRGTYVRQVDGLVHLRWSSGSKPQRLVGNKHDEWMLCIV